MSCVYLLRHVSLPYIKIGRSTDPWVRAGSIGVQALDLASSTGIRLTNDAAAARLERMLHLLHWARRVEDEALPRDGRTEWFEAAAFETALAFAQERRSEFEVLEVFSLARANEPRAPSAQGLVRLSGEELRAKRRHTQEFRVGCAEFCDWLTWKTLEYLADWFVDRARPVVVRDDEADEDLLLVDGSTLRFDGPAASSFVFVGRQDDEGLSWGVCARAGATDGAPQPFPLCLGTASPLGGWNRDLFGDVAPLEDAHEVHGSSTVMLGLPAHWLSCRFNLWRLALSRRLPGVAVVGEVPPQWQQIVDAAGDAPPPLPHDAWFQVSGFAPNEVPVYGR